MENVFVQKARTTALSPTRKPEKKLSISLDIIVSSTYLYSLKVLNYLPYQSCIFFPLLYLAGVEGCRLSCHCHVP